MSKKILFVYSDMGDGGIQRLLSIISKKLSGKYDLSIALFRFFFLYDFFGKKIDLKSPTSCSFYKTLTGFFKRIYVLKKEIKRGSYDLIFAHSFISNMVVLLSKFIFRIRIPVIIAYHNAVVPKTSDMGISGKISQFINLKLGSRSNGIIAVSRGLKNELVACGFSEKLLSVIYNPVDIEDVKEKKDVKLDDREINFFSEAPVIITAGRMSYQKNHELLIRAFLELRKKMKCRLLILGEGEMRSELERMVPEEFTNDVMMPGWVNNPYKYFSRAFVFVLSSRWEGFGNVLVEAMACGVPVVSTQCPHGPDEIITDGISGLLVAENSTDQLVRALENVLGDKKLADRLTGNAMTEVEKFSHEIISAEYDKYFMQIMDQ